MSIFIPSAVGLIFLTVIYMISEMLTDPHESILMGLLRLCILIVVLSGVFTVSYFVGSLLFWLIG